MKINVAVVGMGYWGKNLVRNFNEIGALHTVCDNNPAVKNVLDENYQGVNYQPELAAVLNDPDINAVAFATPAVDHFSMAKQALLAGKDVFVEKPLAVKVEEGEELVKLAKANDRILMVGHILQYHPAVIRLKELVSEGALGQIRYFYSKSSLIKDSFRCLGSFFPFV